MVNFFTELKKLNIFFRGFVILIISGVFIQYIFQLYSLLSKNYIIEPASVYMLDTFHLQGRGYEYKGGKNSPPRFEFTSQNRYSFTIDGAIFQAITDKKQLHDTLMYHDIRFIAFTDKKTFDKYKHEKKPFHINVLQFQIANKKYIDLDKANQVERKYLLRQAFLTPVTTVFIIFFLFNNERWNDSQKSVWGVLFIATLILLCLLI